MNKEAELEIGLMVAERAIARLSRIQVTGVRMTELAEVRDLELWVARTKSQIAGQRPTYREWAVPTNEQ